VAKRSCATGAVGRSAMDSRPLRALRILYVSPGGAVPDNRFPACGRSPSVPISTFRPSCTFAGRLGTPSLRVGKASPLQVVGSSNLHITRPLFLSDPLSSPFARFRALRWVVGCSPETTRPGQFVPVGSWTNCVRFHAHSRLRPLESLWVGTELKLDHCEIPRQSFAKFLAEKTVCILRTAKRSPHSAGWGPLGSKPSGCRRA